MRIPTTITIIINGDYVTKIKFVYCDFESENGAVYRDRGENCL